MAISIGMRKLVWIWDCCVRIPPMSTTVEAIFEHGMFRPISEVPVELRERERVRITIETSIDDQLATEFAEWDAASVEDTRAIGRKIDSEI